jgi:hypothetical protein
MVMLSGVSLETPYQLLLLLALLQLPDHGSVHGGVAARGGLTKFLVFLVLPLLKIRQGAICLGLNPGGTGLHGEGTGGCPDQGPTETNEEDRDEMSLHFPAASWG